MRKQIYLDYNATAPVLPSVQVLMQEIWGQPANASSVHSFGRRARSYLETAREKIAALAGAPSTSVIFTSGATEANNAVINAFKDDVVWVSAIEHASVLEADPHAKKIPVRKNGVIDIDAFRAMLEQENEPALISLMMVNNETGVIQPVEELVRMAKKQFPRVHIHSDAVQAAGRIPMNFQALQLDYMSLSAHKIGGPQGVGALIKSPGAHDAKILVGGGQEKRQRAGTENIAGIAGFGLAAEMAAKSIDEFSKLSALRQNMEKKLKETMPGLHIYGENAPRVANTTAICVPGLSAETQIMALDMEGVAVSSGAACSSGTVKTSHVAKAMGLSEEEIAGAYRISMGPDTSKEDIDAFLAIWSKVVNRMTNQTAQANNDR